jgi:diguanylate cyclase (GGDEF)-like protein
MKRINQVETILFIEDDQNVQTEMLDILEYYCKKVYTANNGQEGLDLYIKYKPDIIMSDIRMPIMDGLTMIKKVKQIDEQAHIIFITAFSDFNYLEEAIKLQIDGYLVKPVDLDKLDILIQKLANNINLEKRFQEQQIILNEIANLQDNMVSVISDEPSVLYANQNFLDFVNIENIDQFYKKYECICELFIAHEGYFHTNNILNRNWIKDIELLEDNKRVVLMLDVNSMNTKSFLVSVKFIEKSKHTIVSFVGITNITLEKKQLENQVIKDELTSIYNRRFFNEELKKYIITHTNNKTSFSLIIFDIDNFKTINDNYGHQKGDEVLQKLAQLVQNKIRSTDVFARWGGEEFVILLPNTILEDGIKIAESLRKNIELIDSFSFGKVTCSFGVSVFDEKDNASKLVKKADDALYESKQNGKNRVSVK